MRSLKIIIETCFWMVAAAAVMFGTAVAIGFLTAPPIGYLAAAGIIVILPVIVRMVTLIRRRRSATVLSYLEQAVRLNLPLPRMLTAAARAERGIIATRLATVRTLLEDGYSVGTALQIGVPEVTPRSWSILDASERLGRLAHALRRLVADQRIELNREAGTSGFIRAYPFMMISAICSAISVVSIFVLPKYQQVFRDFGTKLPDITMMVFTGSDTAATIAIVLATLSLLWWGGGSLWEVFHPREEPPASLGWFRDIVYWYLPVAHGIVRDRGLGDALDLMADALRGGTPANRALEQAAALRVNRVLATKLAFWSQLVTNGMSLSEAARRAGLPRLISEMLSAARGGDQAADVLDFLARYYSARFSRAASLLQAAAVPAITLFFACIVALIAIGLITPMASLIQSLSAHSGRWRL